MTSDYHPIDCDLHDRLEAAATIGRVCVLQFRDGDTVAQVEDRIVDVFARDGAEFIRTADGVEVRLDDIVSLDAVPFRP